MPGNAFSQPMNQPEAQPLPGLFAPKRLWSAVVDLLFPPRCSGCGRVDSHWCSRCQAELDALPPPRYIQPRPPLAGITATAVHDGIIQRAVWSLKYQNGQHMALPLGERIARRLAGQNWTFDRIIPVPLHTKRLKERGYNQSQLLAAVVAANMDVLAIPSAMRRERQTTAQVTLNAAERQANMQGAFSADPSQVSGQSILLIDDVYTTGATLSACAEAALAAGASAVYAVTVTVASFS
jgi:ComF family protein